MTSTPQTRFVPLESLAPGQRFEIAGDGHRRGTVLRVTDLSALVVLDRRRPGDTRSPVAMARTTKVIPVEDE